MNGSRHHHRSGDLLCAMKSESVKETLTAMRQYVGERVKSNAGGAEVKAACRMWKALSKEGGVHRMASAEGCVYVAKAGSMACKEAAAGALWNLSFNDDTEAAITSAGGIPVLVSVARDGSDEGKAHAAGALANLSVNNDNNRVAIAAAGAHVS